MAYSYKRSITIDYTKCGTANSTDFPVLVSFTDATFKTVANGGKVQNSNGYDIAFYSDSALTTSLYWEIEKYVATTGECVFWVKVPTLSASANTVIYVAYGDASISTFQSTATSVWNSNYKGVYHLKDGTTLSGNDSTSNGLNGTKEGGPTAISGKIDGGGSFVSSSYQDIAIGAGLAVQTNTAFSVSAWINTSSSAAQVIMADWDVGVSPGWAMEISDLGAHKVSLLMVDSGGYDYFKKVSSISVDDGTWRRIVITYSGNGAHTGIKIYINGSLDSSASGSPVGTGVPGTFSNSNFNIAARRFSGGRTNAVAHCFNGYLDECRIEMVERSASWITADYNNQNSPSTFFTLGAEVSTTNTNNFFRFM